MKHKGKIGGFFASNAVIFMEFFAMKDMLLQLEGAALYIGVALYTLQLVVGLYMGHQYDRKQAVDDFLAELKSREFAVSFFEKLAALSARNVSCISVYLFSVKNWDTLKNTLRPQELASMLESIEQALLSTIRKSDVVAKWDENKYILIAADKGHKESRLAARVLERMEAAQQEGTVHVQVIIGAATYPVEGLDFETLFLLAQKRLYEK